MSKTFQILTFHVAPEIKDRFCAKGREEGVSFTKLFLRMVEEFLGDQPGPKWISPAQARVLERMRTLGKPVGLTEISRQLSVTHPTAHQHLAFLIGLGLVRKCQTKTGKYELVPNGAGSGPINVG